MGQALLTRAAELGYPQAQFKLAWRYDDGEGVTKNVDSAMHWYRRAAESGVTDAQLNLGVLLEGLDTPDSLNEAVFWLGLAAEEGETKAMTVLASIYFRGPHAIDQDMDKACLLLEQAIQCGDVAAKHLLYVIKGAPGLSSTGDTDLPDDAAAVLECAQDATDAMAYLNIARAKLCSGEYAEAAYWLEIAAEQGVVYAQVELGAMYLDGLGVERDRDKARFWLTQAAEKGNLQAKTAIQMMGPA